MKLSVITLTYNRLALLLECLESFETVTVRDVEFLVFDDASTDGTDEVVRRWHDPRVRYFRQQENKGFAGNAADAFAAATGEYLCSISDDDVVLPGNFERKLAILDANPEVGLVYSLANLLDLEGKVAELCVRPEYLPFSYTGRDEFEALFCGNYIPGPSVVWRREFGWLDPKMPDTLSDWDLWLRVARQSKTAYIAEPLVGFRAGGGMSADPNGLMALGMIAVWRKWLCPSKVAVPQGPPIVGPRTWNAMEEMYAAEIARSCGDDMERIDACAREYVLLQEDYLRLQPERYGAKVAA